MSKAKILIADDDEGLLAALRTRLEHVGFEVSTAENGYQALVEARQDSPDVIVLDINMPAGDGFSVQDRLEKLNMLTDFRSRRIPVIYITGDRSRQAATLATELGAFDLIYKPFEIDRLYESIQRAMTPPPCAA